MSIKKDLLYVNKLALYYYIQKLKKSKQAINYILHRTTKKSIKNFYIGYASNYGLLRFLSRQNINKNVLELSGLAGKNLDNSYYEIFRNRIIIPIINNNKVIGFTGRSIDQQEPKYLNIKKNPLFNKKQLLFGLDHAKKYIYKKNLAILVEGQFDVITMHSHGYKNTVGFLGSAININHINLLKRWCNKVILFLDNDKAGKDAVNKSKKLFLQNNFKIKILYLPLGEDPDSFLMKH